MSKASGQVAGHAVAQVVCHTAAYVVLSELATNSKVKSWYAENWVPLHIFLALAAFVLVRGA